jgi:hypothetical protein
MAAPSVTHTFTNGTTADATEVNTNFNDIINALTDGTSDLTFGALTAQGATTLNGTVALGNATGDTITFTGYTSGDIIPSANATDDLGSSSLCWQALYLDDDATTGGTIYFNAGTTEKIESNAAGTIIDIAGFAQITNDNAEFEGVSGSSAINAGYVGQILNSETTTATSWGAATNTYWDAESLSMTNGIWLVIANFDMARNGATFTNVQLVTGLSTTSGNSSTNLTTSVNQWFDTINRSTSFDRFHNNASAYIRCDGSNCILSNGTSMSGTTLYFKALGHNFTSGTPQYRSSLVAIRVA